jgi:glycosyltransferase involved in cell wall biosynthesis
MFADADVCMAPARWEGLGLHLYEAIAFGQPIVCNDDAPMNELVVDGVNGILVPSHDDGLANSGIPARTVDVDALTDAISRLADPDLRAELSAGALSTRDERNWDRTVADFASLLTR